MIWLLPLLLQYWIYSVQACFCKVALFTPHLPHTMKPAPFLMLLSPCYLLLLLLSPSDSIGFLKIHDAGVSPSYFFTSNHAQILILHFQLLTRNVPRDIPLLTNSTYLKANLSPPYYQFSTHKLITFQVTRVQSWISTVAFSLLPQSQ